MGTSLSKDIEAAEVLDMQVEASTEMSTEEQQDATCDPEMATGEQQVVTCNQPSAGFMPKRYLCGCCDSGALNDDMCEQCGNMGCDCADDPEVKIMKRACLDLEEAKQEHTRQSDSLERKLSQLKDDLQDFKKQQKGDGNAKSKKENLLKLKAQLEQSQDECKKLRLLLEAENTSMEATM
eukprot:216313_1